MPNSTKTFICPECSTVMQISIFANRILCEECTLIVRKKRNKEYEKKRARTRIAKEVRMQGFVCINCGRVFKANSKGIFPKYCVDCRENYTSIYENNFRIRGAQDPKRARKYRLKYRFGISVEQYEAMIKIQNGKCAVCNEPPESTNSLYIDHDHTCCSGGKSCGKCIRQLLCQRCNTALGWINDDRQILESMTRYLKQGGTQNSPNSQRLSQPN